MNRKLLIVLPMLALGACRAQIAPLTDPGHKAFQVTAPDSFDMEFLTTKGRMVVRAIREWSPHGVDRLYALASNNYYDSIAFYRTVPGFVAQFGYSGDTAFNRVWGAARSPDDPVRASNVRGTLAFARPTQANARASQLFFNIGDNARLDTLNGFGFPPIARVVSGVEVLDSLNGEYGNTPNNGQTPRLGNAYLKREFPNLDYIIRARIVKIWK
jgi:cyclophilin family peptidyl-prolyl cis-trans isomerase